jgi:hypothetical protein
MADDRGPWLIAATTIFFLWALLALCVRGWVKLGAKQTWNSSDSVVFAGFLVAVVQVASTYLAINRGYGRPFGDIAESNVSGIKKALFTAQLTYVVSVGLTKASAALFIGHLTRHTPQVRRSQYLALASTVWTVVAFFIVVFRGDLSRPWATIDGSQSLYTRWIAIESIGLAIEAAIFALGISLIWGLQMGIGKRLVILSAFGCRMLLTPILALRLYYLAPSRNGNPTLTNILAGVYTEGVLSYAIISTCITTLKPFLKPFHTGAIVNTTGGSGSGSGLESGSRSGGKHGLYMLGSRATDKESSAQVTTTTTTVLSAHDDDNDDRPRPNNAAQTANAKRDTAKVPIPQRNHFHPDEVELKEASRQDPMVIHATKQWEVQYGDK